MTQPDLARYSSLLDTEDQLDADLKKLKLEKDVLAKAIMDWMSEATVQNVTVGGRTLYVRSQLFVSIKAGMKPQAIRALRALGLKEFVTPQLVLPSVKAWIKERMEQGQEIPSRLTKYLKIVEQPQRGASKSGKEAAPKQSVDLTEHSDQSPANSEET